MDSRSDRSTSLEPPPPAARCRCRQRSSSPCCDTDRADRISGLPDSALLKILAGVRCARSAAHAGELSRRWRGLWRRLPEVHLHGIAPESQYHLYNENSNQCSIWNPLTLVDSEHSTPYARKLQEIVQLPDISVFELRLLLWGDVAQKLHGPGLGSMMLNLLGMFTAIQSLKLETERIMIGYKACEPNCHCDHQQNWPSQNITLTDLKEVEIKNFEASEDEVNLLKLVFRCAPLLKRVTLRVSPGISPRELKWEKTCNLFKACPSVRPYVYDDCGEKMEYNSKYNTMCFYDDYDYHDDDW